MFDRLRNLTKSDAEKRQEALHAYLDDALRPRERQRFEQQLAQDADLRVELAQMRALKQQLRQLPRRQVPRNFTLDPARYGRPAREPLVQAYPMLRAATVLTALLFVVLLGTNLFTSGAPVAILESPQTAAEVAEAPAMEEAPAGVTRIVTETVVEEPMAEESTAADEAAPEMQDLTVQEEAAEEMGAATAAEAPPAAFATQTLPQADEGASEGERLMEAAPEATAKLEQEATPAISPVGQTAAAPQRSLIALLAIVLGVAFVILVVLTVLARRRMQR